MKITAKYKCDVCGKELNKRKNRAILKVRNEDMVTTGDWEHRQWQRYDFCPLCLSKLIKELKG